MESIAHQILSEIADMPVEQYRRELGNEYRERLNRQRHQVLTLREKEVYLLIVEYAMSIKDMAASLSVDTETVKRHLSNVYNKTGTSGRLELAVNYWRTKYQELEQSTGGRGVQ